MRLQLASPAEHPDLGLLPFGTDLAEWSLPSIHEVSGLHRHVVRLVELGEGHRRRSYVVKELPDHLVLREYRLLRSLDDDELPTVDVVAAVTERTGDRDGLLVTRHLDYSLPYRSLLSGRGLRIPYLGERLLDALVGLLVRLHLAGFFWGDCSLSNTLFRRDAGALSAFVIDVETSERYPSLTDGQRQMDLDIATENVAGGLLDLQIGGRLVEDVDPWEVATNIEDRYRVAVGGVDRPPRSSSSTSCGGCKSASSDSTSSASTSPRWTSSPTRKGERLRMTPRVVESGYHEDRLFALTGLVAEENQARRLLNDIRGLRNRDHRTSRQDVAREHRRRALARPALRADDRQDPSGADRQAAGGRDLPPGPRAPMVLSPSARSATWRSTRRWRRTAPRSSAAPPTSKSASTTRWNSPSIE